MRRGEGERIPETNEGEMGGGERDGHAHPSQTFSPLTPDLPSGPVALKVSLYIC